jgi:hypothetical protein
LANEIGPLTEEITSLHIQLQALTDDVEVSLAAIQAIDTNGRHQSLSGFRVVVWIHLLGHSFVESDKHPFFLMITRVQVVPMT